MFREDSDPTNLWNRIRPYFENSIRIRPHFENPDLTTPSVGVGLLFSPLHSIIPFLMMGIGVDDMFVIMQCFNNIEIKRKCLCHLYTYIIFYF